MSVATEAFHAAPGPRGTEWINGVEFVADFHDVGGGYSQDHEFFGYRQAI